ncbi:MAG: NAD-dependent epimerase/dehydratase family protein [Nocardioides sp.]
MTRAADRQTHVVVGVGPVGTALAGELLDRGHRVRVVSRSGRRPHGLDHPLLEALAVDAADPGALAGAAEGAGVLYNAANPTDYHRWAEIWPPLAASLLTTAERTGAVLATVGNLYSYGPVDGPMHEGLPDAATFTNGRVRAEMWADALAAHQAGRVRTVEVRASDYAGPGVYSHLSVAATALLGGKTARVIGSADQPHSWTDTRDTARLLVAAAADESAHGRTWIVPSNPPRTQREALTDLATAAGVPMVRLAPVGRRTLRLLGLVSGTLGVMADTCYQFDRPFVVDDRAARSQFGLEPTPWATSVRDTLEGVRRSLTEAGTPAVSR